MSHHTCAGQPSPKRTSLSLFCTKTDGSSFAAVWKCFTASLARFRSISASPHRKWALLQSGLHLPPLSPVRAAVNGALPRAAPVHHSVWDLTRLVAQMITRASQPSRLGSGLGLYFCSTQLSAARSAPAASPYNLLAADRLLHCHPRRCQSPSNATRPTTAKAGQPT